MADDAEESARRLAEQHGLRYVDLTQSALAPGAASLLPEAVARRHHAVPIGRRLGTPVIAVADPGDLFAMDALRASVGREFVAVVARPDQVARAIRQLYTPGEPDEEVAPVEAEVAAPQVAAAAQTAPEPSYASVAVEDAPPVDYQPDELTTAAETNGDSANGTGEAALVEAGPLDVGKGDDAGVAFEPPGPAEHPQFDEDQFEETGLEETALEGADAEDHAEDHEAYLEVGEDEAGSDGAAFGELDLAEELDHDANGNGHPAIDMEGYAEAEAAADADAEPLQSADDLDLVEAPGEAEVSEPETLEPEEAQAEPTAGEPDDGAAAGTLEESLREVLSPPAASAPFVPPIPAGTNDALDLPLIVEDEPLITYGTDALGADVGAGVAATLAVPPPPPEYSETAIDGEVGLPPVPDGYGLVDTPEGSDPVFYGPPLARVLVESGRVSSEDMAVALQAHQETGESLARYLYNQQLASEDDLVWAMAQEVGLEFVDLDKVPIEAEAAGLIPEAVARHHMVLPIRIENGIPVVALANPTDVFAMDDLRTIMGRNFTPVVATRSQIALHLRYAHNADVSVADVAEDAAISQAPDAGFELERLQAVVEDAPIVRYVNLLILQALNERASDIHIEPTPKRLRIRFRIDGVMHDATSASQSIHSAVVSRLKVLGEMDITEHRVPQEGRVSLQVSDRQIDLRLATLPSIYGETCVMRLLDKSASIRSLPELGFFPDTLERYAQAYNHPYGVILVTGPTGAGKTTTLYATLKEVTSDEKSVVTVEDPVEYQIDGITQVQINRKAGLAFSTALKSILRADPDIVLIGEIRDTDTATIAMEAALSGHLVLSTLHTNTAAATPLRLTEMGIEPFLVTSSVGSVLTQRLARVLCEQCKEPYDASEKDFYAAGYKDADLEDVDISVLYRAVGCRSCSHTGYLGREVLAEVMNMTEEIDRMIIEQETIVNIERQAIEQGMRTLRLDGLMKAVAGDTTLEEVLRVVV